MSYTEGGVVPNQEPNEDTMPAILSPGEVIVTNKLAKRIGIAKLVEMNGGDSIVHVLNEDGTMTDWDSSVSDPSKCTGDDCCPVSWHRYCSEEACTHPKDEGGNSLA